MQAYCLLSARGTPRLRVSSTTPLDAQFCPWVPLLDNRHQNQHRRLTRSAPQNNHRIMSQGSTRHARHHLLGRHHRNRHSRLLWSTLPSSLLLNPLLRSTAQESLPKTSSPQKGNKRPKRLSF